MVRLLFVSWLLCVALALPATPATARTTQVAQTAFACTSWAAWHDYSQASLTPKGARASKLCPIRLAPGTPVEVIEEDSGEGATTVRYKGRSWVVDNQRLR